MSANLIDTHCHLHDQEFYTPEEAGRFLDEAKAADVKQIIVIGTDPEDARKAQEFAAAHEGAFWTYGIHPEWANAHPVDEELERVLGGVSGDGPESVRGDAKLVAVGEIGLDYHYEPCERTAQIRLFERMLQLAMDLELPVSLHIREAFEDALAILDNFPKITGVVHSFTGSKKLLREVLARDFYVGVNGLATYSTLPLPPLEKMLLETDAPFLTPVPFRGKINVPGYVRYVAANLAEKLDITEAKLAEQTTQNAKLLFHLQ